jgi:hypothetical protein
MHRRLIAAFECIDYRVEMYIKSAVKFPIEVVEVPGLPYLGGLVAGARSVISAITESIGPQRCSS